MFGKAKWIAALPLALAVCLYGAVGVSDANAQQQQPPAPPAEEAPPAPPPEEAPPAPEQPPAPPPEEAPPAPEQPPAPPPEEAPPAPEQPPAPPPEEELPPLEDPMPEPEAPEVSLLPEIDIPDPAAEVNGLEISGELYAWVVDRMNDMLQHAPPAREEAAPSHEALAESLVDQGIFLLDAEREGVQVSDDEVDAAIDAEREALMEPEVFEQMLEAEGLSEPLYREKVEAQLVAQEHAGNLVEDEDYGPPSPEELEAGEDLTLVPDDETALQVSGLVLDLTLDEHRVMEQRVDDVRDEFDTQIHVDLEAAEEAEPVEPEREEIPIEEPTPIPEAPEAPAPEAPAPDVDEPAPAPEAPAPEVGEPLPPPDEDEAAPNLEF